MNKSHSNHTTMTKIPKIGSPYVYPTKPIQTLEILHDARSSWLATPRPCDKQNLPNWHAWMGIEESHQDFSLPSHPLSQRWDWEGQTVVWPSDESTNNPVANTKSNSVIRIHKNQIGYTNSIIRNDCITMDRLTKLSLYPSQEEMIPFWNFFL